MIFAMKLPSTSYSHTKTFEQVNGAQGGVPQTESVLQNHKVFDVTPYGSIEEAVPARHTTIDDLVAEWNKDEERSAAMEEARHWLAQTLLR